MAVAAITFSLNGLGSGIPEAERIFNLAALVVPCSIVAHGLIDTPGKARGWHGARRESARAERVRA